jgi:hypothetical protein
MKVYFRFYLLFFGLILILCVLWGGGAYVLLSIPTSSRDEAYSIKKDCAESIKGPKLIVVAGSSGEYGISAEKLEEGLGIPAVNMATNVGRGLKYILHQTRPVVKSGDWILAPLEYILYTEEYGGEKPTEDCVEYVFANDHDYFRSQSLWRKLEFIAGISVTTLFKDFLYTVFPLPKISITQQSRKFNRNGDMLDNLEQNFGVTATLEGFLLEKEGLSEAALRMLSDFIDECRQNGAQFLAAYPSLLYDKAYLSEITQKKIADIGAFYVSKNVPVLGTFEDFLYPIEDMYDTRYHLNAEGRKKMTQQLLQLLKPYISQRSGRP